MPDGKPKKRLPMDLKSLARSYTKLAVQTLGGIAEASDSDAARVTASIALLDRGWGKPNQPHTGEEGGDIQITIRTIMEGAKK